MILIFGVELLRKYLKKFSKKNICFYDDYIKEYNDPNYGNIPFFKEWKRIRKVLITDEFIDHHLFKIAHEKNIPYETDVSLFLRSNHDGIKIGIMGNNYKSSFLYLIKYILGDLCSISKKLGESPLDLPLNTSYVLEISDRSIDLLRNMDFQLFDILIFTDLKTYNNIAYSKYEDKFKNAKKSIFYSKILTDYPDNFLFTEYRYQVAWDLLLQLIEYLHLDKNYIKEKLKIYSYIRFKREVVHEYPLIINDSNATTIELLFTSLNYMKRNFILICNDFSVDVSILKKMLQFNLLKKIFILSSKNIKFFQCESFVSDNFEKLITEAFLYARNNNYDLLFSPGGDSFKYFSNYQERGEAFNKIIESLVKDYHQAAVFQDVVKPNKNEDQTNKNDKKI